MRQSVWEPLGNISDLLGPMSDPCLITNQTNIIVRTTPLKFPMPVPRPPMRDIAEPADRISNLHTRLSTNYYTRLCSNYYTRFSTTYYTRPLTYLQGFHLTYKTLSLATRLSTYIRDFEPTYKTLNQLTSLRTCLQDFQETNSQT